MQRFHSIVYMQRNKSQALGIMPALAVLVAVVQSMIYKQTHMYSVPDMIPVSLRHCRDVHHALAGRVEGCRSGARHGDRGNPRTTDSSLSECLLRYRRVRQVRTPPPVLLKTPVLLFLALTPL